MSSWEPIETAPKDGTKVDLWANGYGRTPDMCWRPVGFRNPITGWTDDWYGRGRLYAEQQFTHWMHRPDPPSSEKPNEINIPPAPAGEN